MTTINYTPAPTIKEFIRHYEPGQLFYDWVVGPVGGGKTTGIFFKLAYMAMLQDKSPIDGKRKSRAVIVRNTAPQLRDTTLASWNLWFKDGQAGQWKATDTKFILRFGDVECEVLFRPLDTPDDIARVLSLEVTFAILDEFVQIDKTIVEALSARLGRYPSAMDGGATNWGMWGASNPGNEDDWWFEYLYGEEHLKRVESGRNNVTLYTQPSGFSADAENIGKDPHTDRFILPGGPEYYHNLALGKPEHWVKQFIEVQWGYSLSGKPVVPTFKPDFHVAKKPLRYSPNLPLVAGFDPGMGGSAMVLGQMDMNGRLQVFAELVQQDMGADRFCTDRLLPLLRTRFPDVREFIIAPDPAANTRNQTDERTVVDVLKRHKFRVEFVDMNNQLPGRLNSIEHFTTRITVEGPALLIDPSCRRLIQSLQSGWRYSVDKKGKRSPEPEKNDSSHVGDAFGYLCKHFRFREARYERERGSNFHIPRPQNSYAFG